MNQTYLTIVFLIAALVTFSLYFYPKTTLVIIPPTKGTVKYHLEDSIAVGKIPTVPIFETIPNEVIEQIIEKENALNYNQLDVIRGTQTGWKYEIRNGRITLKTQIKNGIIHGRFWTFYSSGNIKSSGEYKNGKKEGLWVQFFENGEQVNYGKFEKGFEVGEWVYYDTLGHLLEMRKYINANQFLFSQVDSLEKPTVSGTMINDQREGEWRYFYQDKIYKKETYKAGLKDGAYEEWLNDSVRVTATYKGDKIHGITRFFNKKNELFQKLVFEQDSLISREKFDVGVKK